MSNVSRYIGHQALIELGGRNYEITDSPVLMVSNRYDIGFKAVNNAQSKGVYCSYKP